MLKINKIHLNHIFKIYILNLFVYTPFALFLFTIIFKKYFDFSFNFKVIDILLNLFISISLISEIYNFFIHKLFHKTFLYKFHKIHHEIEEPLTVGHIYSDPFEHLLFFCMAFLVIIFKNKYDQFLRIRNDLSLIMIGIKRKIALLN